MMEKRIKNFTLEIKIRNERHRGGYDLIYKIAGLPYPEYLIKDDFKQNELLRLNLDVSSQNMSLSEFESCVKQSRIFSNREDTWACDWVKITCIDSSNEEYEWRKETTSVERNSNYKGSGAHDVLFTDFDLPISKIDTNAHASSFELEIRIRNATNRGGRNLVYQIPGLQNYVYMISDDFEPNDLLHLKLDVSSQNMSLEEFAANARQSRIYSEDKNTWACDWVKLKVTDSNGRHYVWMTYTSSIRRNADYSGSGEHDVQLFDYKINTTSDVDNLIVFDYGSLHFADAVSKASHNSYELSESYGEQVAWHPDNKWVGGCRALELDLHANGDNWNVYHFWPSPKTFEQVLRRILDQTFVSEYQDVITIFLEMKTGIGSRFDVLDDTIKKVFPNERLYTVGDLLQGNENLKSAIWERNWPLLNQMRGKYVFVVGGKVEVDAYQAVFGSQRVSFLMKGITDGAGQKSDNVVFKNVDGGDSKDMRAVDSWSKDPTQLLRVYKGSHAIKTSWNHFKDYNKFSYLATEQLSENDLENYVGDKPYVPIQ